ncbi:unnamed protein product [Sphagnum jensenii]
MFGTLRNRTCRIIFIVSVRVSPLTPQSSLPTTPVNGDLYYDAAQGTFVFYDNGFWINLASQTDVASAATLDSAQFTAAVVQNSLVRITGSTISSLYGLTASTGGKQIVLYNEGTASITVYNQNVGEPTAANRISTPNGQNIIITTGESLALIYDAVQGAWVVASGSGGGGSSSGQAQEVAIPVSTSSLVVTFPIPLTNTTYVVMAQIVNITDVNPMYIPVTITNKTNLGFTATWNAPVPTGNYFLDYAVAGAQEQFGEGVIGILGTSVTVTLPIPLASTSYVVIDKRHVRWYLGRSLCICWQRHGSGREELPHGATDDLRHQHGQRQLRVRHHDWLGPRHGWHSHERFAYRHPRTSAAPRPNLAISTVSSGQLEGGYSLSYAMSAASTAGNMVASSAFYIDQEDQAKVLTVKFYYKANSGASNCNFSGTSSNSFAWAAYDVTNSVWLSTTGNFNLVQSSGVGYCTGTIQTGSSTQQIALCFYNATATSGAATLYLDSFYVGPQTAADGSGDDGLCRLHAHIRWHHNRQRHGYWVSAPCRRETTRTHLRLSWLDDDYQRAIHFLPSIRTYDGYDENLDSWRRRPRGCSFLWRFNFRPSWCAYLRKFHDFIRRGTLSPSRATTTSRVRRTFLVQLRRARSTTSTSITLRPQPRFNPTTQILYAAFTGYIVVPIAANAIYLTAGTVIELRVQYTGTVSSPLATGGASLFSVTRVSGPAVVAATESVNGRYHGVTATITSSLSTATYSTKDFDSHNAYSSGTLTIPVSGKYQINAGLSITGTFSTNNNTIIDIVKNGTQYSEVNFQANGSPSSANPNISDIIQCNAGDTINIQVSSNSSGPAINASNFRNYFSWARVGN